MMRNDWRLITDLDLGVLRIRGADAINFLQGQLSNDASRLQPGQVQLTGYHTPQGRAIAVLRLIALAADDVAAILPRELVAAVAGRLKRYVLRSKVQILEDSAQWQLLGFKGAAPALQAGVLCVAYGRSRQLVLCPQGSPSPEPEALRGTRSDWVACDIEEGLPQVYTATSEAFVAQMLNLDATFGIAFDKGCYTGQEIIARAHYRGHVKRRMQRFVSEGPCTLAPGHTGVLGDGRGFKVVDAVPADQGRCEFLAVANAAPGGHTSSAAEESAAPADTADTQVLIAARQLALPYALPDIETRAT